MPIPISSSLWSHRPTIHDIFHNDSVTYHFVSSGWCCCFILVGCDGVCNRRKLKAKDDAAVFREVEILRSLGGHEGIINLIDFFVTPHHFHVVMELARGGDVFDRLAKRTVYTEREARRLARKLLETIDYVHSNGIVHRDLKAENLLLMDESDETSVKIADFGFATYYEIRTIGGGIDSPDGQPRGLTTRCGTPAYVAPEILLGVPYNHLVDMWSCGVLLFILLGGYTPFTADNRKNLFRKIRAADYIFDPRHWDHISVDAKKLIASFLIADPTRRIDAGTALKQNGWLNDLDDESLSSRDLSSSLSNMRIFNARRKLKGAVYAIAWAIGQGFWNMDTVTFAKDRDGAAAATVMTGTDGTPSSDLTRGRGGTAISSSASRRIRPRVVVKFSDLYELQFKLRTGSFATVWEGRARVMVKPQQPTEQLKVVGEEEGADEGDEQQDDDDNDEQQQSPTFPPPAPPVRQEQAPPPAKRMTETSPNGCTATTVAMTTIVDAVVASTTRASDDAFDPAPAMTSSSSPAGVAGACSGPILINGNGDGVGPLFEGPQSPETQQTVETSFDDESPASSLTSESNADRDQHFDVDDDDDDDEHDEDADAGNKDDDIVDDGGGDSSSSSTTTTTTSKVLPFTTGASEEEKDNKPKRYAIKVVTRAELKPKDDAAFLNEVAILQSLRHPKYVVALNDFFEEPDYFYMVMELMDGGDVFDRIVKRKLYTELDARNLARKLLKAVSHIHSHGVAHRDLKPQNLLLSSLDDDSDIKVADFGFAKRVHTPNSLTTRCGTPTYVAPEILKNHPHDHMVDMWSVGVIVYCLLVGYPPFLEDNQKTLFKRIRFGQYEFFDEDWENISVESKHLIQYLLVVDPSKRMTAKQALRSRWMKDVDDCSLSSRDLSTSQCELRKSMTKMKFKAAIHATRFIIDPSKGAGAGVGAGGTGSRESSLTFNS